ncbi:BamA/TamA family outer membrane protein [Pararhodonellum marinum]|uniref:BamA/TamA family outer membrane protein n=1 Tax=Pararhodonellum marinum TaxID=2755358 RepID=UPI00188EE3C8|nr:BamA/TamA family outer membrane protein [Pararhodonellum marinum]
MRVLPFKSAYTLFLALMVLSGNLHAQMDSTLSAQTEPTRKLSIIPLPVISSNPTSGLILGVAPSFNWFAGDPSTTSMSTALGMALVTTKRQLFTSMRSNAYLKDDAWVILTDIRFNINNQPTYGLGTKLFAREHQIPGPLESADLVKEMIYFNHFRFYGTALKRHQKTRFFYRLGYHFDAIYSIEDEELDLESNPQQLTFHHQYQTLKGLPLEAYRQSGISMNLLFDSRDNVANPYDGQFMLLSWRVSPEALGSTVSGSQLWVEYRNYFTLNRERPRNLLAFWTYGWTVTGGDLPYMFLPALGWDMFSRSGRPYTFGRFRGEDLVYGELEWRFPLQQRKDRFGGVIFVNTTSASSRTEDVALFSQFQLGYGLGIRYMVLKKKRVNIGLDYGWGTRGASGIFLNVNEMF